MGVEKIDVSALVNKTKALLENEKISFSIRTTIKLLLKVIKILINQKTLNSRNSSIPPSKDPNRPPTTPKTKRKKKPGGQKGHKGSTLEPVDNPDEIKKSSVDRSTLPSGDYKSAGVEKRQVFDVKISLHVTEYQSEVLEDQDGNQWVADFPEGINNPTQYGNSIKAHCVYMSQFQLIPQRRVSDYCRDQLGLPLSKGSIQNFNQVAYEKLKDFEIWAYQTLLHSPFNNADETGVNVNKKGFWLHLLSNKEVALYHVDPARGSEAMNRMGVLPEYNGILCHDHWKPYYTYPCTHALCNAHHIRELERAHEQDNQKWAKRMQKFLVTINKEVNKTKNNVLSKDRIEKYRKKYRSILFEGEKECPENVKTSKKRGAQKQSKSRNLLNRLKNFENDTLRFMTNPIVSFTNNRAENDLRMTKVQQKISGCFRSLDGAKIFCRVRSYLLTCQKNEVNPAEAMKLLFEGKYPDFIS